MTEREDLDIDLAGRIDAQDKRIERLETLEGLSFAGGGWTEIETVTVNAAVDIISILNIPPLFLHLVVMINGRTDTIPCDSLSMRMNNDSGDNYWYQYGRAGNGAGCVLQCAASFAALTDQIMMNNKPGPSWDANVLYDDIFGVCNVWIPDYRNQYKHKSVLFDNHFICAPAEEISPVMWRVWGGGTWHSDAPITRLDFPNRFIKNSKISVYGIGGTFVEHA